MECVGDNFLTELVNESAREGTPPGLLFVNREGLVGDAMVGGHLGHSDHEMIEFLILREGGRGVDLKGTGAGHPHVPKDKPVGKKTSLPEHEGLPRAVGTTSKEQR